MLDIGWEFILDNSEEINNSLKNIKEISKNYQVCILTKVHSVEEQNSKKKFWQEKLTLRKEIVLQKYLKTVILILSVIFIRMRQAYIRGGPICSSPV